MTDSTHAKGHRQRLRRRFIDGGRAAVADYELLELILFAASPRGDVKPLAKRLLRTFGSLGEVAAADTTRLAAVDGVGDAAIAAIKACRAMAEEMIKAPVRERNVLSSWRALLDYCHAAMAREPVEQLRLLFLDKSNTLIAEEIQQQGTIDETPIYPREVVKRALANEAAAVILVHNHPSGDPMPSAADLEMTRRIRDALRAVGIELHDHLIIARKGHASFRNLGLL